MTICIKKIFDKESKSRQNGSRQIENRQYGNYTKFFFVFFYSVERPFQDYFTHRDEPISVGGAKQEYPRKTG